MWIVGEHPGDSTGLAFIEADVEHPGAIPEASLDQSWMVAKDGGWIEDSSFLLLASSNNQGCINSLLQSRGLLSQNYTKEGLADAPSTYLSHLDTIHETCAQRTTWEIVRQSRMACKPTDGALEHPNGLPIPLIGFGTGATHREDAYGGISGALKAGYRLLDTASAYDNEDLIGEALVDPEVGVDREEVFIISKVSMCSAIKDALYKRLTSLVPSAPFDHHHQQLWFSELGMDETLTAASRSLARLGTDYFDAYLM